MITSYLSPAYCSLKLIKENCWLGLDQFCDLRYVILLPLNLILFLWKMGVIFLSSQGYWRIKWEEKLWKELSKLSGTCSKWELFLCLILLVPCRSVFSHGPVSPVKGQKFWGFWALSQKGKINAPCHPFIHSLRDLSCIPSFIPFPWGSLLPVPEECIWVFELHDFWLLNQTRPLWGWKSIYSWQSHNILFQRKGE